MPLWATLKTVEGNPVQASHLLSVQSSDLHFVADDTPPNVSMDVAYDLRCQSDPLRVTRHNRVYGASLCPVSEKKVALIMSDSRVIFWELQTAEILVSVFGFMFQTNLRTSCKINPLLPQPIKFLA